MASNNQDNQEIILYQAADGRTSVALYARDSKIWLNQQKMAELFATSKQNISLHVNNVLKDSELSADSVVKEFLTTAADGKQYNVVFYSLEMILAVGYRVRSVRGTQFRQWATRNLSEYLVKGFLMDDERLKNPDGMPLIGNNTLVALTLMIAESRPEEMEVMIKVVVNLINKRN